jgi:hypothetical protein
MTTLQAHMDKNSFAVCSPKGVGPVNEKIRAVEAR